MPTFLSLYAGAGGMDLGFVEAGFTPIWTNELNPDAVNTYKTILPEHTTVCADLNQANLPTDLKPDLIIGGPPCQGFSVAGKMDPNDPRSQHVWNFLKVVDTYSPESFVMENVKALYSNSRWSDLLKNLILKAESMGYFVNTFLLNAADFGVPQLRERMFMVGSKSKYLHQPKKSLLPDERITVREALSDLPKYMEFGNDSICTAIVRPAKNPILRKSPYAGMLFNGQGRPLNLDRPALTLPASMGGNRTPIIDQKELEQPGESWVQEYHSRLLDGEPSESCAPSFLRRITVEEAARLQTFPIGMKFKGSQSSQYKQIGNAVPPLLAKKLAISIKEQLCANHVRNDILFESESKMKSSIII